MAFRLAKRRKSQGRPHAAKEPTYSLAPNRNSAVVFSPWNHSKAAVTGAGGGWVPRGKRLADDGKTLVPDERTSALAEYVRERAAGISLAEAARRLNADRVPTPSGGGKWHPATVKRILAQ